MITWSNFFYYIIFVCEFALFWFACWENGLMWNSCGCYNLELFLLLYRPYETQRGIPVYKCVYRYTVRIPVLWYTGIPNVGFTCISADFWKIYSYFCRFSANLRVFLPIFGEFTHIWAEFTCISCIFTNFLVFEN